MGKNEKNHIERREEFETKILKFIEKYFNIYYKNKKRGQNFSFSAWM